MEQKVQDCKFKLIPYGDGDFYSLRTGGFAYVDKTIFIEKLEKNGIIHPFIVRPRRFGKTLFTSMLKAYYDEDAQKNFALLFHDTYIASHKTATAGQYRVLRFDFSGISSQSLASSFCKRLRRGCSDFARRYKNAELDALLKSEEQDPVNFITDFFSIVSNSQNSDKKIYVIIDEYDQFANELLSENLEEFKRITSKNGFLKQFYANLKSETVDGVVAHVFITGVTSVSMDSMSSGFNIGTNITSSPEFADMFGFNEAESKNLIAQVVDFKNYRSTNDVAYGSAKEELFERMKLLYDGYRFSPDRDLCVLNPSMSLYYLRSIVSTHREPRQLLDPAMSSDFSKVDNILRLGDPVFAVNMVERALKGNGIPFEVPSECINLNSVMRLDEPELLTIMLCMGYLTYAHGQANLLQIPNRAVAQQFFECFQFYLQGNSNWRFSSLKFEQAFLKLRGGDPHTLLEELCGGFTRSSGIHRNLHLKESDFQTLLQAAMFFSNDYITKAELEVNGDAKGYADLLLHAKNVRDVSYLFEIKYLPQNNATSEKIEKSLLKAKQQLLNYVKDSELAKIENLKCCACVFLGNGQFVLKLLTASDMKVCSSTLKEL